MQIVDPKQKLNQPFLFYYLLSKLKILKINCDKFAEEIIKMSFCNIKRSISRLSIKGDWI